MNKKKLIGLNQTQVDEKISQGLTNDFTSDTSTSNWQIVKRNVSPFLMPLTLLYCSLGLCQA